MLAVGIVAYVVICAVMAVWMVAAAAMAGTWMRLVHFDIARTHSFALVRRYGLRSGTWRLLGLLAKHPARVGFRRPLHAAMTVVSVPLVSFMGPAFLFYMVGMLVPVDRLPREFGSALQRAVWITGALGAVVGTYVWLRGLSYIAHPQAERRGRVPRLMLPSELGRCGRDRLAVNAFWLTHIRTAELFAAMYPFFTVAAMGAFASQRSAAPPSARTTTPTLISLALLLLAISPMLMPAIAAGTRLQRRFAASQAAVEICSLLRPTTTPGDGERRADFLEIIPEPEGTRREDLARISDRLHEAAGQLDAQQPRGFAPHPTATLLRGVAETIRQFLRGPHAYGSVLSLDLSETLRLTLLVLAGPRDPGAYGLLASRVSAFDEAGNPSVELFVKPPGRIARLYARATASVARTAALVAAFASIAVPLIATALVLLGKIDAEQFLGHLK